MEQHCEEDCCCHSLVAKVGLGQNSDYCYNPSQRKLPTGVQNVMTHDTSVKPGSLSRCNSGDAVVTVRDPPTFALRQPD